MCTPTYVKIDVHNHSEGVCSQLGIVEYHPNVWPGRKLPSSPDTLVVVARLVRMLKTMTVPARQAVGMAMTVSDSNELSKSCPVFEGSCDPAGVTVHDDSTHTH